jgi:hypothetical protein
LVRRISCNIRVKQGCPLCLTLFGIYTDKLEYFLEEAGCANTDLARIVILLLLYVDDIILLTRNLLASKKNLKFLNNFCTNSRVIVNIDKPNIMIIKSRRITYPNFVYNN